MDRKSILVVIVCFIAIFLLSKGVDKLYPPKPAPVTPINTTGISNAPAGPTPSLSAITAPQPAFSGSAPEETIVLTNENAYYTFTSHGGGLQLVELTHYPQTVSHQIRKKTSDGSLATLNTRFTAPTMAILGDGVQDDGIFTLTGTATGVRAEKTLTNGLHLIKEFELSSNYLVETTVRWENPTTKAVTLPAQEWVVGTSTPMDADDKGLTVGVMWYNGAKKQEIFDSWFSNKGFKCSTSLPRTEYRDGATNVVWAAAENQFFALVAMPAAPADQVVTRPLDLPRPTEGPSSVTNNPTQQGCQTALVYQGQVIAPGQMAERKIVLYAGPKEYRTLAHIANRFQNNVDLVMGFGAIFGIFSKALLLAMNGLHNVFNLPYGWAIIVITVLLKVLFWPLTTASMRTARRMASFQPQMNALKEKFKDDPMKLQKKMGEFWKEHKVHPANGCLPMAVQIPVFIGLYGMIRTAIELRGAHFLWIPDLSKPDTLYTIAGLGFVPFIGIPGVGLPLNPLPIVYIISALWQSHLTPPSPGMDPSQQRLMRWMPLMFLAILYNFSSGLALYMTVQNLLTIVQTKIMKTNNPPPGVAATVLTHPPKKL